METVQSRTGSSRWLALLTAPGLDDCRVESVSIDGHDAGTFSNFQQGTWVTANGTSADTADGRIDIQINDAREGSNVVASEVDF